MKRTHAICCLFSLAVFISISGVAAAQSTSINNIDVVFDINPDNSVMQSTKFYFSNFLTEKTINYTLADRVTNVKISDDNETLAYNITQAADGYDMQITLKKPTRTLQIDYVSTKLVFKSDSISQFFTEFSFEGQIPKMNVSTKLPAGQSIYRNSYQPRDASIASDGNRIILIWEVQNVNEPVSFSVKFSNPENGEAVLYLIAIALAGSAAAVYIHFRKKNKEVFLSGFREDEKKTVEYLRTRKTALQRDLQDEFGFSRAKATRIVMHLEKKGLVKKQKYGRTNKLFWLNK